MVDILDSLNSHIWETQVAQNLKQFVFVDGIEGIAAIDLETAYTSCLLKQASS